MKTLLDETPEELPGVMAKMRLDQVASLLEFATSWNTKTKDSREAQVREGGDESFSLSLLFSVSNTSFVKSTSSLIFKIGLIIIIFLSSLFSEWEVRCS